MRLLLKAPLSGIVVPLDQVPDPVFAQRMVGDGVSIDPVTASLTAPCDGRVVQIHSAAHAVTLASSQGVEILMHIGLDTVQLKGHGFAARVKNGDVGQHRRRPDRFRRRLRRDTRAKPDDADRHHIGDRVAAIQPASGSVTAAADTILSVMLKNGRARPPAVRQRTRCSSGPLVVSNASGLHARPSAVLASRAKQFNADQAAPATG